MNTRLICTLILGAATAFSFNAEAAALYKHQVSADAKWLLHLDFETFRATKLGEGVTSQLLGKVVEEIKDDVPFDFAALAQKIRSITAYGTEYENKPESNGVMLVQMDAEAQKILEGFLAAHKLASKNDAVQRTVQDALVQYAIGKDVFVAIRTNHLVLLGKSQQQIEKANKVLAAEAPSLARSDSFSGFPDAPQAFFFLAVAEGFGENASIPPQARVLQMTEGARVVFGERAEKLFLELMLKTKSPEVGMEILQVLEGMRALISLSQSENRDLEALLRAVKVTAKDKLVTVMVEYPVAPLLEKLSQELAESDAKPKKSGKPSKPANDSGSSGNETKPD